MKKTIIALALLAAGSVHAAETFIAVSPSKFSTAFNVYAGITGQSIRMPAWPASRGPKQATLARGVTVTARGTVDGRGMEEVKVACARGDGCGEAFVLAALAVDPDVSPKALETYIGRRLSGELDDESAMTQNGIEYYLDVNEKAERMVFTIEAEADDDEGDGSLRDGVGPDAPM